MLNSQTTACTANVDHVVASSNLEGARTSNCGEQKGLVPRRQDFLRRAARCDQSPLQLKMTSDSTHDEGDDHY